MIGDIILIVIAGLIVASVGYPFVEAFSKWKKQMDEEGKDDVQN